MCMVIEVVSFYLSVAKYSLILVIVVAASSAVSHSHTLILVMWDDFIMPVFILFLSCLFFSFSWLMQVRFLGTLCFCNHWWQYIVWNRLQDIDYGYGYGYYLIGCGSCWFQGQKAWDSTGFKSSCGCFNRSVLGQVSCNPFQLTVHTICTPIVFYLYKWFPTVNHGNDLPSPASWIHWGHWLNLRHPSLVLRAWLCLPEGLEHRQSYLCT